MGSGQNENVRPLILKYSFSLALSLITVSSVYFIWGIYWEDSMKMPPQIIYGLICSPPYEAWFNESFLLQPPIFAFLSTFTDKIPIYGIWHLLISTFYVSLWFFLILRILNRNFPGNNKSIIALSNLIIWSLLGNSIFYLHLSREAILLMSGSLFLFFDFYLFENKKPTPLILTFLLGCLMRVSLSAFVLSIVLLLFSLHLQSIQKAVNLFKYQILVALTCLLIVLGYKNFGENQGVIIEQQYEYAIMDGGARLPLSQMKTAKDSIKYVALMNFFLITDSANINLDFIKTTINYDKILNATPSKDRLQSFAKHTVPILVKQTPYVALFCLVLLFIGLQSDRKTKFSVVAFNLLGWFIIVFVGIKLRMYERFLLPWIATLVIGSAILFSIQGILLKRWQKIIILATLLLTTFWGFREINEFSKTEREYNMRAKLYLKNLEALSATSVPIIWDYSQFFFPSKVLSRSESVVFKKCIYQTLFFASYFKFGQERCIQKLGFSPLDWKSMGIILVKNHEKVSFVMDEKLANFLTSYFKAIYDIDFVLVKTLPVNEVAPDLFVFHLKLE